jgi:hypothetical protein
MPYRLIFALEGHVMPDATVTSPGREHREAVRLSWKSRHIPFGTILVGILLLGCLLPTILTIFALGPVNPIP